LGKEGFDGKCQARHKSRGATGYTSGLQQRMALVDATELFKSFFA